MTKTPTFRKKNLFNFANGFWRSHEVVFRSISISISRYIATSSWKQLSRIYTYKNNVTRLLQLTEEETDNFCLVIKQKNITTVHDSNRTKASGILVNTFRKVAGGDFTKITASALHTVQRKRLQITNALCRNFKNVAFTLWNTMIAMIVIGPLS